MDPTTITLFIAVLLTVVMSIIGVYLAGFIGAILLGTLVVAGLSFIPATPILPIWIVIVLISCEVILMAYKVASGFGLGKGSGND